MLFTVTMRYIDITVMIQHGTYGCRLFCRDLDSRSCFFDDKSISHQEVGLDASRIPNIAIPNGNSIIFYIFTLKT